MQALQQIFSLLNRNKSKIALFFFSVLFFAFFLFPFGDLADLVSGQVSKLSGNQVYLEMNDMQMSVLNPGIALQGVRIEAQGVPPLKADEIVLSPSVMSLLTFKPAGTATATGFLNGNIEVSVKPGPATDAGNPTQNLTVVAQRLSLSDVRQLAEIPWSLKGNLNLNSSGNIDLSFKQQPDIDVVVKIDRFELPAFNLETMLGPLMTPDIKFSSVEMKGRLSGGKFLIQEGVIGKETDELRGTVRGQLDISFNVDERTNRVIPFIGGYTVDLDILAAQSFQNKISVFLPLAASFETPDPRGKRFRLKISAQSLQSQPSVTTLR